ncbi:MAG: M28 family peptidase, partial [Thermoanaerobaculales bacterium]|nr:M28 family peptidase [Thermoanaerobaculales bacterium]
GGYDQRVPLHASLALEESRFEIWNLGTTRRLRLGDDYLLATAGSETLIPRRAPMVFVGYGIVAPEFDYNDYLGIDVRGKVVVFLAGEPPSDDPEYFQGSAPTIYSAPATKAKIALTRGAAGSLMIPEPRTGLERAWEAARRDYAIESLSLAYSLPEHLTGILHPRVGRWLLADVLYDLDAILEMAERGTLRSFHLPTEMSFVGRFRQRDVVASNLVAVIDGADPELRSSFVVVLAHYDHLGIGPAEDGDGIYNGVVDNALGVSCLLEIAGALSTTRRTRRSVIVLFTTAEEAGLLGARSFLADPPVPAARMAAAVNIDGLAFLDDFEDLVAIGGELSDLGRRLEWAARRVGLEVSRPPDAVWDHAAYVRGDQLAFAEAGVPSVLVNEGFRWPGKTRDEALATALNWMAETYHSPRDDLDQPLNYDAAARHCGAIFELIVELADDPEAPRWNPRSPYAYERALSIALDR